MKKILVGMVIGIFLFSAAIAGVNNSSVISAGQERESTIERTYVFDEPLIKQKDNYLIISMDGVKYTMHEGQPVMPYKVETFTFPVGTKIDVEAKEGNVKEMEIKGKIQPYPYYTLLTTQGKLLIKEGEVYKEKIYPENWVEYKISVGLYNGKRVAVLSLFMYPCRYMPEDGKLLCTDKINVKITYTLPSEPLFNKDEYDLLIICPSQWVEQLQPLKEHKEKYGIKTIIVSLDEIYGGKYFATQGRDDAEKVKYFIKDAIENWGIEYVMLVGGRQGGVWQERWLMPVRYTNLDDQSRWEASFLSDLYFADIYKYEDGKPVFDDWDSNGNGKFAEWSQFAKDTLDLMPDVYVGRLACRNKWEVDIMVNKIISYESKYVKNEDWFRRMVVVGGDTFPPKDDPYYEGEVSTQTSLNYMEGFEGVKLWTSLGTLTGPEDVIREVSKGCGFLNFEGHGNPMSWATHPPHDEETWIGGLIVSDMPKLSNKDMYPVCVVGGCHNSQFNVSVFNLLKFKKLYETYYKSEWSPECWSWWLARKIDGGSIATIGCTGLGYGYIGDYNDDGIPDCIQGLGGWIDIEFFRIYGQEGKEILGEIHSTAIANYVMNFPVMKDPIDCKTVEEWVLLGDPTLKIGGYPS